MQKYDLLDVPGINQERNQFGQDALEAELDPVTYLQKKIHFAGTDQSLSTAQVLNHEVKGSQDWQRLQGFRKFSLPAEAMTLTARNFDQPASSDIAWTQAYRRSLFEVANQLEGPIAFEGLPIEVIMNGIHRLNLDKTKNFLPRRVLRHIFNSRIPRVVTDTIENKIEEAVSGYQAEMNRAEDDGGIFTSPVPLEFRNRGIPFYTPINKAAIKVGASAVAVAATLGIGSSQAGAAAISYNERRQQRVEQESESNAPITTEVLEPLHESDSSPSVSHYQIQAGDTLYSISKRFGIELDYLKSQFPDPNKIAVGQELQLTNDYFTYQVEPQDTLYSIAKKTEHSVEEISAANLIEDTGLIHPGQLLVLKYKKTGTSYGQKKSINAEDSNPNARKTPTENKNTSYREFVGGQLGEACYDYTRPECAEAIQATTEYLMSNINLSPAGYAESLQLRDYSYMDTFESDAKIRPEKFVFHWTTALYDSTEHFIGGIKGNPACKHGCSVHFFVNQDAQTYQLTEEIDDRLAHARGFNSNSIGIEIEARDFFDYTPAQIAEAMYTAYDSVIKKDMPMSSETFVSHAEAGHGKVDPPPSFVDAMYEKIVKLHQQIQDEEAARQAEAEAQARTEAQAELDLFKSEALATRLEDIHGADKLRTAKVIDRLVNLHGFSPDGSLGFTGNLIWESAGLDPCVAGDDGASIGLAQWQEARRDENFPYCGLFDDEEEAVIAQVDYSVEEMMTTYPEAYNIYTSDSPNMQELEDAAYIYERYGVLGRRMEIVEALQDMVYSD